MLSQIREAEGNYTPMVTAHDIMQAIQGKLVNQSSVLLNAEEIDACDEEPVKPVGKGWIKKYHHFQYRGPGIVACSYIKGGPQVIHKMVQGKGTIV